MSRISKSLRAFAKDIEKILGHDLFDVYYQLDRSADLSLLMSMLVSGTVRVIQKRFKKRCAGMDRIRVVRVVSYSVNQGRCLIQMPDRPTFIGFDMGTVKPDSAPAWDWTSILIRELAMAEQGNQDSQAWVAAMKKQTDLYRQNSPPLWIGWNL